jgi:hypothetical protein
VVDINPENLPYPSFSKRGNSEWKRGMTEHNPPLKRGTTGGFAFFHSLSSVA